MKHLLLLFAIAATQLTFAQRTIDLQFPTKGINNFDFISEWGDIKLSNSDDNQIHIKGSVSINFDEKNDWFEIKEHKSDGTLSLQTFIQNEDEIINEIIAYNGEEQFRIRGGKSWRESEAILEKALGEDHDFHQFSHRRAISVTLEILVPESILATLNTEHGDIDVNCVSAMDIRAKHGHISVTFDQPPSKDCMLHSRHDFVELIIPNHSKANLQLKSEHGVLYTNFNKDQLNIESFPTDNNRRQYLRGSLNNGDGVEISLASDHDDVYLRGSK